MGNLLRKYISPALIISNLIVFLLYTLVSVYAVPFTAFSNILLSSKLFSNIFNLPLAEGVAGKSFLSLLYVLLLSTPLIALFVLRIIKVKKTNEEVKAPFYYDRAFNLFSIINNYFFLMVVDNLSVLKEDNRGWLANVYIFAFVVSSLLNLFELALGLGYLDLVLPKRDFDLFTIKSDETKKLAREAKMERIEQRISSYYFFIAISALLGIVFFIFPLVTEMFTIPLGGDYTQQQIPFYTNGYDDWWHFLKTGEFPLWDPNTFLGVNNIGSNSFYYSMNPFFLPILLFPRDLIPQGIAILMIAKFTLAAVTMRAFLKYMKVSEKEARLFAIIYAFCGWNAYYLWFNHFMEVAVLFPLVFLGIEKLLKEKKMLLLIIALGLMGFANYFFLMTVLVLGVLYAGFRYFQLLPNVEPSIIGLGILAFALGTLLSSVVLFPSLAISLNSDRATGATYLDNLKEAFNLKNYKLIWEILTKWEYQRSSVNDFSHKKYYPLISYFFPVLSDRSSTLLNTSSYDNTISSIFSFSPVIMLFPPAMFVSFKKGKYFHFVAIFFFAFALFTPFFYNLFHGFTKEYGRWQLIVSFLLITYVALSLPDIRKESPLVLDISLVINLVLMAFCVKIAYTYEQRNGFSYINEREYIIFYQFAMLFVTYIVLRFFNNHKHEYYYRALLVFVEIAVMGTSTMVGHGFISYKNSVSGGLQNFNDDQVAIRNIQSLDDSYYRIYNTNAIRGNDNLPMRENYNGLGAFHSLYNYELMDFNNWSKVNYNSNGWSLGIFERRTLLYDFLQVKYYVLDDGDHVLNWSSGTKSYPPYKSVPNHYTFSEELSTENRFVYKVNDTFDVGFGVDYALTGQTPDGAGGYTDLITNRGRFSSVENEELYLQTALLSYEDLAEVLEEAPQLGTKTYANFNRKTYTKITTGAGLKVNYYEFSSRRYPYEAQIAGGSVLPTPEWVAENGTLLPASALSYLDGSKHVIEYTRTDGGNLLGEEGGEIILNLPLTYYSSRSTLYNYRYRVFLYDEDYKLITFDDHNSVLPSSSRYWKTMRAYHSPVAVKKVTLVPIGSKVSLPIEYDLYLYEQSRLDEILQGAIDNSLQNVDMHTNYVDFTTDYATKKFVVTTIPYDPGWKLVKNDKDKVDVYKVQGGFVGFIGDIGETSYTLSFAPSSFNISLILSVSALIITALLEVNVHYFKKSKKRKEELKDLPIE